MKEKLAQALQEEYDRLSYRGSLSKTDYDLSIKYLKTGEYPSNWADYDLLYACKEDFNQLCKDYDIEK